MVTRLSALAWLVAFMPSACMLSVEREKQFVREKLEGIAGVKTVSVSCGANGFPRSDICATVAMADGAELKFFGLGYRSFGAGSPGVFLSAAGGRSPLVVSCDGSAGSVAVDRAGLVGHHFSPPIDDVSAALRRHRDLIEELEFWPQCPQFWEVASERGTTYRYCAHASVSAGEPPPAPCPQ